MTMTRSAGFLFSAITYDIEVHPTKKSLVEEHVAIHKSWARIFRGKPTISQREMGFFLEEEHVILHSEKLEFIIWKILFEEKIGWIQYYEPNIKIFTQK